MSQNPIIVAWTDIHEPRPAELATLSTTESDRAANFKVEKRRREYLCGRTLLRAVLQRHTGDPAASHELITAARGKPACVGGPAVSIGHSGRLVVCAVTDKGEIGIDIEMPGRRRDIEGIARNYFAADEAAWLATQPADRFYMLWVLKEAWLKAKGAGITGGLDRLCCFVTPPAIEARVTDDALPTLSLFSVEDAVVGLATTAASHASVVVERWDPSASRFDTNMTARLTATTG